MLSRFLSCGQYAPDLPDYGNTAGTKVADNVVAVSATSYSPLPAFVSSTAAALDGTPLGAFATKNAIGDIALYAGTADKLYVQVQSTTPNFQDISNTTPYTTPSFSSGGTWSFATFGGAVYASNYADPMQSSPAGTTTLFANVGANAPKARRIAVIRPGFLIAGDIIDVTVGAQPQGVRWSALGDATLWPLIGSNTAIANESDWQKIEGAQGTFQAFAPDLVACNAAIFFERSVHAMIYTGDTNIFAIQAVDGARGTPAPQSVVQFGQTAFYLGDNGFYAFDGSQSSPIGAGRVDQTFFADCDPASLAGVTGIADPLTGRIFWFYSQSGQSGVLNRALVYHSVFDRWSRITSFSGACPLIGRTFGVSLDGIDALGYNLDTLPYSLDSSALAGGALGLYAFDQNNVLGSFVGGNMAFAVDTVEAQLAPGKRARANAIRPIVEGDLANAGIIGRTDLVAALSTPTPVTPNNVGICPVRSEARYHRVRLTAPAGNAVKHIQGAEVTFTPAGMR